MAEHITTPPTAEDVAGDYRRTLEVTLGHAEPEPPEPYPYRALALTLRDRLVVQMNETRRTQDESVGRRTIYISLEYLLGRLLSNAALNLGMHDETADAMRSVGYELEEIVAQEQDPGLGNGGLGRLAACFLDSCATLALPVVGYGLRYQYGLFVQRVRDGYQVEEPDTWLTHGFPWEIRRSEFRQVIRFGGRTERRVDANGRMRSEWVDTQDVLAEPYDVPIPGYRNGVVNTLRLWSAAAIEEFDLDEFNAGDFTEAVAARHEAGTITSVLYPNDANERGVELRLRQQYFLSAASLGDCFRAWRDAHGTDMDGFAGAHCFQLNDTHPAIAVAELMRLLLDQAGLDWDAAWQITSRSMAYTNHTLLPEALESWPVPLFDRLLPRLLEIIYEINARFLTEVARRWPGDVERQARMSIIGEGEPRRVRMAHLAVIGSFSVNGVAALHSELIRTDLFRDFAELWPERFGNKTNGVTPRRWIAACNPGLADLITDAIGDGWVTDLTRLSEITRHINDASFRERWLTVRRANKERLARLIRDRTGVAIDSTAVFDVQVKRVHEYKRQLMNVLHAVHLYCRIRAGRTEGMTPRLILIGGVAAPGYQVAKRIIKFANNVAAVINSDPAMANQLQVVFLPGYNVSTMEVICPAADLSSQISTAGKEASGTGNMKFMMNGAVTIGTLDGANIEIRDAVGPANFFAFGLTVAGARVMRETYDPAMVVAEDDDLTEVLALIRSGHFNQFEPGIFDDLITGVLSPSDPWLTAADFRAFVDAHHRAGEAYADRDRWVRMSIANCAASGRFSSDRTIAEYNADIWGLAPITLSAPV